MSANGSHLIDAITCTKCELCVAVCPAMILQRRSNGEIAFRTHRTDICIHPDIMLREH